MQNRKPVFWHLWVKGLNNGKSRLILILLAALQPMLGHPDYPGNLGHFCPGQMGFTRTCLYA